jgi:uncharacterized protein (TIGR03083 family)
MTDARFQFASAAETFAVLVRRIPEHRWEGPGLGEWSVRDLVGHTSRSLVTVSTYLQTTAAREDVASAAGYYARMREYSAGLGAAAIVERGRQAARDLGDDPAAAIDTLLTRVTAELDAVDDDPLIEVIGGLGIRLSNYLSTRTFELAVHGLDIATATGVDFHLPRDVLTAAVTLAARIGVEVGDGHTVLLALTGRRPLPPGFSVV